MNIIQVCVPIADKDEDSRERLYEKFKFCVEKLMKEQYPMGEGLMV